MDALERIRSIISGFAGYDEPRRRRLADEQIRGFVGETLAELPAIEIDALTAEERACYDRVLLRCEFTNQDVFRVFDGDPTPERVLATLSADADVVEMARAIREAAGHRPNGTLPALSDAFDKRDAAMRLS
jgi:hypothetical protein